MSAQLKSASFQPFYLQADSGERFCIHYRPCGMSRGAILYVHPFAEEMNKSRRVAAAQSRMLAAHGYTVVQMDLFGCGDSSGEFGEARWDIWKEDLALAVRWIRRQVSGPLYLWGLRLGALLALDYAAESDEKVDGFLLWQPVLGGEAFVTQFLRLRVASGMMSVDAKITTQQLRAQLDSGARVEVAGYELAPELTHAIDRLKLVDLRPRLAPAYWIDVVAEAVPALSPPSQRTVDTWLSDGIDVQARAVCGEPFWSTIEHVDSPQLLAETACMLGRVYA